MGCRCGFEYIFQAEVNYKKHFSRSRWQLWIRTKQGQLQSSSMILSFVYRWGYLSFLSRIVQQMDSYRVYIDLKEFIIFYIDRKMQSDANQARFIRKRHAEEGLDEQEEEEERQFGQNLQKALQQYGNKNKRRDIESQVEYFGHMIEPFNMREEEDMGDIDQEGYFVFKRKNEYKDAWLQSIQEQNDMMVADKVKKRIKTEGAGWRGVYDDDRNDRPQDEGINQEQNENDDQENDSQQYKQEEKESQVQEEPQVIQLQPTQIKQLISELLPMNKSANGYIKQLKKKIKDPQTKQLHDKILQLCNLYIQKTNEYDILTLKKEQLQIQLGNQSQSEEEINWDQDSGDQQEQNDQKVQTKNLNGNNAKPNVVNESSVKMNPSKQQQQKHHQSDENDDIF